MLVLIAAAFVAGLLTILAPCTLPVIPLVVGSAAGGGPRRPLGVVVGFGTSFVLTAVVLAAGLAALGLTTDRLRALTVVGLACLGLALLMPRLADRASAALGPLATWSSTRLGPIAGRDGFIGGVAIGSGLGLLWAPCVGPIMAGVIAIAVSTGASAETVAVAVAYVVGVAVPMFAIARWGRGVVRSGGPAMRRIVGVLMVAAAIAVATGFDYEIQARVGRLLPDGYAATIASIEKDPTVDDEIDKLTDSMPLEDLGPAPEVRGITAWMNSEPLTLASLRGKVVLVHFWTFGCYNCRNVQPYVKAWYDRYEAAGFTVLSVHTPELSFERDITNVRQAVVDEGVRYPVAFDPDYATWYAYANHYWPAFYFVDKTGRIRHEHFGEGDYDGSERVIRELLAEPAPAS